MDDYNRRIVSIKLVRLLGDATAIGDMMKWQHDEVSWQKLRVARMYRWRTSLI